MEPRGATAMDRLRRLIRAGAGGSLKGTVPEAGVDMGGDGSMGWRARCAHRANDRGRFALGEGRSSLRSFDDCAVPGCSCAGRGVRLTRGTPGFDGFVSAIIRVDANLHCLTPGTIASISRHPLSVLFVFSLVYGCDSVHKFNRRCPSGSCPKCVKIRGRPMIGCLNNSSFSPRRACESTD